MLGFLTENRCDARTAAGGRTGGAFLCDVDIFAANYGKVVQIALAAARVDSTKQKHSY